MNREAGLKWGAALILVIALVVAMIKMTSSSVVAPISIVDAPDEKETDEHSNVAPQKDSHAAEGTPKHVAPHDRPIVHGIEFPGFDIDEEMIIAEFDEVVEAGNSLLTRGYEISDGVFLYTKLTPTTELKLAPGQKNFVRLEFEQFAADISGNYLKDKSVISSASEYPRDERNKSGGTDGKSKYTDYIEAEINVLDDGKRFRLSGEVSVAPFKPND